MRGNIVVAAAIFAGGLLLSCVVLLLGARWVLNGAADRLADSVRAHANSTERAGEQAGGPIRSGLVDMSAAFDRHGKSVEVAGATIAKPHIPNNYTIHLEGPVSLQQPLMIRGPREDGALPVNAVIGK